MPEPEHPRRANSAKQRPAERDATRDPQAAQGKFLVDPRERALGQIPDLIRSSATHEGSPGEEGASGGETDDATAGSTDRTLGDEQTHEAILQRLRQHPYIDALEVRVEVHERVVRMFGVVADRRTQLAVEQICSDSGGGRRIEDHLEIREAPESRDAANA